MNNFIFTTVISLYLEHGPTLTNFNKNTLCLYLSYLLNKDTDVIYLNLSGI